MNSPIRASRVNRRTMLPVLFSETNRRLMRAGLRRAKLRRDMRRLP